VSNILLNDNYLALPDDIVKKLKGKTIKFVETAEGILLKITDDDPISMARGSLKGSNFCTETYLKSKVKEKEMEK
jgi:hypothetical protein